MRNYSELSKLRSFEERFRYLMIGGAVGAETFGYDRYLNQVLYNSSEWKKTRDIVILRDLGCDLGIEGYEVKNRILIHHMNPITQNQIINRDPEIFNPEYLISTTHSTHNAIHYGDESILKTYIPTERRAGDTKLW